MCQKHKVQIELCCFDSCLCTLNVLCLLHTFKRSCTKCFMWLVCIEGDRWPSVPLVLRLHLTVISKVWSSIFYSRILQDRSPILLPSLGQGSVRELPPCTHQRPLRLDLWPQGASHADWRWLQTSRGKVSYTCIYTYIMHVLSTRQLARQRYICCLLAPAADTLLRWRCVWLSLWINSHTLKHF